jgi:hypothetical protein
MGIGSLGATEFSGAQCVKKQVYLANRRQATNDFGFITM